MTGANATDGLDRRPRVLIMSMDRVGDEMAGAGIRACELARVLADRAEVSLLAREVHGAPPVDVPCATFDPHDDRTLRGQLGDADVVVAQPQWPLVMRGLRRSGARLVFDLYDPVTLETLEYTAGRRGLLRDVVTSMNVDRSNEALRIGHYFTCASDSQRDMWIGAIMATDLLRPGAYDRDPSFRSVIDVVPFGVPDAPPRPAGDPWTGIAGIDPGDEVVLWNGGIWNWLDAPTAIRAIGELSGRRPSVKLMFMGASSRPEAIRATREARTVAADAGLLDRVVFFNDSWVPYDERGAWLLNAACALACHVGHLETRFAFRTRVLDCFWAGLPVISTAGDSLAVQIERDGLGEVVPERDAGAVAAAVERVLERGKQSYAGSLARAAERHRWSEVAEPLVRFVHAAEGSHALGRGRFRRPAHQLRSGTYCAVRTLMNAAGVDGWPGGAPSARAAGHPGFDRLPR